MVEQPVHVLLIEDDEDDYVLVRSLLSKISFASYELKWVPSYHEALEAAGEDRHDVCLLDFRLGEYDGLELLAELTRRGCRKPIIFLTGQGNHQVDIEAMTLGASDFLIKGELSAPLLERSIRYAIERKRAEEKLAKAKAMLQTVFNGISEPLLMVDKQLGVRMANEACCRYFQIADDESIIGKTCLELANEACTTCEACPVKRAVSERNYVTYERRGLLDPERFEQVTVYPAEESVSGFTGGIIRISDITESKTVEKLLTREDRLSSLGQLSGGIAHEIRNPLAGINLFVDILCDEDKFNQTARELSVLGEIKSNVRKIDGIIKRILDFSKQADAKLTNLKVSPLIHDTVRLWRSRLSSDGIKLNLLLDEDLPDILGDAIEIQQVITNLVQNAVEAMNGGGVFSLSAKQGLFSIDRRIPAVIIKFQDTGNGIPVDQQQKVFDPFFTTKAHGTGLGLAIVHRIVSHHGGILSLESTPGAGTTFCLELPLAPKD